MLRRRAAGAGAGEPANGSAGASVSASASASAAAAAAAPSRPGGGRAHGRSASFERVNAVVRALSRPEEDATPVEEDALGEQDDETDSEEASDDDDDDEGGATEQAERDVDGALFDGEDDAAGGDGASASARARILADAAAARTAISRKGTGSVPMHRRESSNGSASGRSPSASIAAAADDELSDGSIPRPAGSSSRGGGGKKRAAPSLSMTGLDGGVTAGHGRRYSERLTEEEKEAGRQRREELRAAHAVGAHAKSKGARRGKTGGKRKSRGSRADAYKNSTLAKGKKSWEIPRKIFHSSIGFLVLHLYLSHHPLQKIVSGLSAFLGVVITADIIRLNSPRFERLYERVLGFLMRESEKKQVNGVVWYLIGVITCLRNFPADIACIGIMILSWCDTSASVFGRLFGKYTRPLPTPPFAARKSLAGFIAASVSGAAVTAFFWATPIARIGERADGLSWAADRPAVFGTRLAPGPWGTGWTGFAHGFRGIPPPGTAAAAAAAAAAAGATSYIARAAAAATSAVTGGDAGAAAHAAAAVGSAAGSPPPMPLLLLCAGAGLVAGVSESLELGGMDDNLTLPILSATGIWGLLWAWGRFSEWAWG